MSFSSTLDNRFGAGNVWFKFYTLTDVQSAGSDLETNLRIIYFAKATNETDLDEQMGTSWDGSTVTITSAEDNDDGRLLVIGTSEK